jgi:DNA-binding beta-propeller fold protein YncE
MIRRLLLVLSVIAAVFALSDCGTGFKLPAEVHRQLAPGNGQYKRLDTRPGYDGVVDLLLTKSTNPVNEQLYVLYADPAVHGGAGLVALTQSLGDTLSFVYPTLQHPVAVCGNSTRLFVLDQGDSCLAHAIRPSSGRCDSNVVNFQYAWRVREFFPDGGDTVSTFTDTTMAWVQGIAVDDQQRIYVSGLHILVTVNPDNPFYYYRRYVWRVFRYIKGGSDPDMPGAAWHRDESYAVEEGSGLGTIDDPRGLDWTPYGGGALFIADTGNNRAQRRSDPPSAFDYLLLDGAAGAMVAPTDVSADLAGYSYVIDSGHEAVYRFVSAGQGLGEFVQQVDIDVSAGPLVHPIALAADDDKVYVVDQSGALAVFQRLK